MGIKLLMAFLNCHISKLASQIWIKYSFIKVLKSGGNLL